MTSDVTNALDNISYRELLRIKNAKHQLALGVVSRFPISASGVAIVVAVSAATSSYTIAGIASAIYAFFAAVMAPVWARQMDRSSQKNVLLRNGVILFVLYWALSLLCYLKMTSAGIFCACAIIGFFSIDIGSVIRTRWLSAVKESSNQKTAFMLESAVDEAVFAVAPLAVTVVAAWNTSLALIVVSLGPIIGFTGLSFLPLGNSNKNILKSSTRHVKDKILNMKFVLLLIIFVSLGGMLGSIEVILVSVAMEQAQPFDAGLALASWATGSGLTALLLGKYISKLHVKIVLIFGLFIMTGFSFLLSFELTAYWQISCCFFAGAGAAPAISSGFTLTSEYVSESRVTEALALLSTGLGMGTVIGASLGGIAADNFRFEQCYYLSFIFGLIASALAILNKRTQFPECKAYTRST